MARTVIPPFERFYESHSGEVLAFLRRRAGRDRADDLFQETFLRALRAYGRLEHRDRVSLLRAALAELPPTLRTAVMLRDIQELSYQEIATTLHLPEGTVKSRINRGRTELARQIQKLRDQQDAIPKTGVTG